ncbi:MAG: hypothetical protein H0X30_15925 [Anaerolineae bacterium]|nr:hypothetical protein [Anaerolineae bacterium]
MGTSKAGSKRKMTLKEAKAYLAQTQYMYSVSALRAAAQDGRLKAKMVDGPLPYYVVSEADLLAWCADPVQHKTGKRKAE